LRRSRIIGILIIIIQVGGLAAFALGVHTLSTVFSASMAENKSVEIKFTDPVVIPYVLTPKNNGYLEAKVRVSITLISGDGKQLATDTAQATIPPHSQKTISLELNMPLSDAQKYLKTGSVVSWVVVFEMSTLFDLINFSDTVTTSGGL
jgi:hypothetical protein